ncbi:type II toxin-antitoxin system VapC family toxin [Acidithiobacillus montserratensis]|uniref:Type II toxin-antitoxin system VapC family toxin n=1 Tax=Acidithiobacillus montserratensis TaxID=2729135 RepID=A0ACD5HG39_9PROT|nr:type II toxin-antitoxin system VapC family toxin [Acidithiobacillus montserratensis]MBN2678806.1 type II toxin-antitoxin system VapC family toxin [Acidithiobacillaceae bacterium]MBU2748827.1 type II toxin-antitoxin system VapC family toxin [Acidithiobacillus montserratensis]
MSKSVLDASAMLAYLNDEPGADFVEKALVAGGIISTVNWAEVLSKVIEIGIAPEKLAEELKIRGILESTLEVLPLTIEDSTEIAHLRLLTRSLALSLGDRACLALGKRLRHPVLTADRIWAEVPGM